jgi:23S rRNA pseudouridine2605 synthase
MEKKYDPERDGDFNRDDSNAEKRPQENSTYSPFAKDKRPRIRRVTDQLNERVPRSRPEPDSQERSPYSRQPQSADDRRPYGHRPDNRDSEERRPYGYRPDYRDNRSDRDSEERRPYDRRPDYRDSRDNRAPEERRPYDRRPDNREPHRYSREEGMDDSRRRSYNPNFDEENRLRRPAPRRYDESPEEDRRFNSYQYDRERPVREGNDRRPYRSDDRPRYSNDRDNRYDRPAYPPRDNRYGGGRDNNRNYPPRDDRNARGNNNRKPFRPNDSRGKKPTDPFKTPKGGYDSEYKPKIYPAYSAAAIVEPIRLNKFISMSGLCSRREADEYIRGGQITVNGTVVTEMGIKISPTDEIHFNGEALQGEKRVYILMNKPKGFVTTVEDPNADRTVMDIVKNACKERVYPVGRLDKNSLGVLLITNDGELTKKLTHPGHEKKKVYQVTIDRPAAPDELQKLLDGVDLDDGPAIADDVELLDAGHREIGITIHTGRNRIVRRMFEALGYHVQKLDRVYFAGLTKKSLRRGAWRYLTPKEVAMLKTGKYE